MDQPTKTIDGVVRAVCPGCEKPFSPGVKVEVDDDGRWWHEACAIAADEELGAQSEQD